MATDGSDVRQVTNLEGQAWSPGWSPDGGQMSFICLGPGAGAVPEVCTVDLASGVVAQYTDDPRYENLLSSRPWSPDGTMLLLSSRRLTPVEVATVAADLGVDDAFDVARLLSSIAALATVLLLAWHRGLRSVGLIFAVFVLPWTLAALVFDEVRFVPAAVVAAILGELAVRVLRPWDGPRERVAASAAVVVVAWVVAYLVTLVVGGDLRWSPELAIGVSILCAGRFAAGPADRGSAGRPARVDPRCSALCHDRRVSPATSTKPERMRLDQLLVERGLVESRSRAQALLMAGKVRVGEGDAARLDRKAGDLIGADVPVTVLEPSPYVSRGGHKLAAALDAFGIDPSGAVCLDVGASTGGFTDVLLQRGARRVYALDVGRGQLAESLRRDPRVVSMERTNARDLTAATLPEPVSVVSIDVSFISLGLVLGPVASTLAPGGHIVPLVKPQFEAGRGRTDHGVVRDPAIHREVLERVVATAQALGLGTRAVIASPITGPEGNREFLLDLATGPGCAEIADRIAEVTPA